MGTDIHGWIEVRYQDSYETLYEGVIKATYLMTRDYDMFGCLFGVCNIAGFVPATEARGFPADASIEAYEDILALGEDAKMPTWIEWQEIVSINWDEDTVDSRPHCIETLEDGRQIFSKGSLRLGHPTEEGATWTNGNREYTIKRIKRRDALDANWRLVFKVMETLAEAKGADAVRLVVWFDN